MGHVWGGDALFDSKTIRRAASWSAGLATLAACSSLDPGVGAVRQCVAAEGPPNDSQYYSPSEVDAGSFLYAPASDGATQTTCSLPAGSRCDDCESTNCCATRLACYADPTCAAADQVNDECLADASAEGGASACLQAFVMQGGTVAGERVACERTCCQTACSVP